MPAASRPSVLGEPQPQVLVSVIASSTPEMPSVISAGGAVVDVGRRLDRRLGDVAPGEEGRGEDRRRAGTRTASGRRGSRSSTPANTTPAPPPMPSREDTSPIAPATRSCGSSSRMIEKASGKMPPPTPWITRPSEHHREGGGDGRDRACRARAAASTIISRRSLPYMSPSRPMIGVVDRGAQQEGGEHPADGALGACAATPGSAAAPGRPATGAARTTMPPRERTARMVRGLGVVARLQDRMTLADRWWTQRICAC